MNFFTILVNSVEILVNSVDIFLVTENTEIYFTEIFSNFVFRWILFSF